MSLVIFDGMIDDKSRTQGTEVRVMKPEPANSKLEVGLFTRLIEKMREGVLLVDIKGRVIWANPAAIALHGCKHPDELEATPAEYRRRFVLRDSNNKKLADDAGPLARMARGESFTRMQAWLSRTDSVEQQRLIEFSSLTLSAPDHAPAAHALIIGQPRSQNAKTEWTVHALENNPLPAVILRLDDSRFIRANDRFAQLAGLGHERISGLPLHELNILRDAELRSKAMQALATWHPIEPQESTVPTGSGQRRHIILAGQPVMIDGRKCMLFTCHDQDAQKKAMTSLCQSNRRHARIFQLAPLSMLICRRAEWAIIEVNDAFLAAFGHGRGELPGKSALRSGLRMNEQDIGRLEQALSLNRSIDKLELELQTQAGATLNALLSAEIVGTGKSECILLAVKDITARRRSGADLAAAIEAVMEDTSWFTQTLMEKLAEIRQPQQRHCDLEELTPREQEVLAAICKGRNDTELAESLGISPYTVRSHLANLYAKIDVKSRSAAIVWGRERGLGNY